MKKVLFVPAMALLALVYFASCKPVVVTPVEPATPTEPSNPTAPTAPSTPEEPKVYYTVTYTSEHGTAPETKTVLAGTVLNEEDLPELEKTDGFGFVGWYIGDDKIESSAFAVNGNVDLTAKWVLIVTTANLSTYLAELEENTVFTTPYEVMVSGTDLASVKSALTENENKYVSLFFTDCDTMTSIDDSAFEFCSNLKSVVIPNSVRRIGDSAFSGCANADYIIVPNCVMDIGESAFCYCLRLKKIILPSNLINISQALFYMCQDLESVEISNNVTNIDAGAFIGCVKLKIINIPASVENIGLGAFGACEGLETIIIHDSVVSIGEQAFGGCTSLTTINYTGTEEQWNAIAKGDDWNIDCPANMTINYNYTAE